MITLEIASQGGRPDRTCFERAEVTLGHDPLNDVVLVGDDVANRHARFVEKDLRLIVVDFKSETGVHVNGRRITSPIVVKPGDRVQIGSYTLRGSVVLPAWPDDADVTPIVEATELRLLDAIAQGDDVSRLVYADWLDERGRPERAEWLRLLAAYATAPEPRRAEIRERLEDLKETIEVRWRLRVARPRIARCSEAACPKVWEALAPTSRRHIRACGACARDVYYCGTATAAHGHHEFGDRVAVDIDAIPEAWR